MPNELVRLLSAAAFAAEKHRDQRRKSAGAAPYINHPLTVAAVLADDGGVTDVALLTAALLHDTVEDTETTQAEITKRFGSEVGKLVAEVTDDKSLPKVRRKQLQIETAPGKSDRAKQLKIADKICNLRDFSADSPAAWDTARKLQYLDWSQRVVHGCRGVNANLDRLFDQTISAARERLNG